MKLPKTSVLLLAAVATTLSACTGAVNSDAGAGSDTTIAVLLASTQNGYNQAILTGVREAAADAGLDIKVFDAQFDSNTQLSQLENLNSSSFAGAIVLPNDGVSLAAAFPLASELPVVTVTNPIGPDIVSMDPQTPGVISTVGVSPALIGKTQAEDVVKYCQTIDPCKVAIMVGFLTAPLDTAINDAYKSVLSKHPNIVTVATVEGEYDRDKALAAASNILQANPDVHVFLSNTDQQTSGISVAVENAGIDPSTLYLTGTGGTEEAIEGVRSGAWQSTYSAFPVQRGQAAVAQLVKYLEGMTAEPTVNADQLGAVSAWITSETLRENPDFVGDWNG